MANVQMSPWGDRDHGECYINLAVAPAPWLEFESRAKPLPKTLSETCGLFRDRLGTSWDIPLADAAESVVLDMVAAMERAGWPLLNRLLDRTTFLDHLRTVGLGEITLGLIIAATLIGAAFMMRVPSSWILLGYPGIAILFFLLAALAGVALAVWIITTDRKVAQTDHPQHGTGR